MALTEDERGEINARMLELYGYTLDDCEAAERYARRQQKRQSDPMPTTASSLRLRFGGYVLASRKKKGAGKGYKETYEWRWRDYKGYMAALRELSPTDYALRLCRDERECLLCDRWWDTPDYRGERLREYRSRITAIRKEHGLTSSEVAEFMRVA